MDKETLRLTASVEHVEGGGGEGGERERERGRRREREREQEGEWVGIHFENSDTHNPTMIPYDWDFKVK